MLTKPDFTLPSPNPRKDNTTDAVWWLRCHLLTLASVSRDGGTYANKKGFHNKGKQVTDNGQGVRSTDYSIRDAVNRTGSWWRNYSSAFDWTFTDAQRGDYKTIDHFTSLLLKSALDPNDPRLDMVLFEFYGQADSDGEVEGYDEFHEKHVSSDPSHLWHLHFSFLRKACGDFWAMWALLTVLMGWDVRRWKDSLPETAPKPPMTKPTQPAGLTTYRNGSRVLSYTPGKPLMKGTDVRVLQLFIGEKWCGKADGIYGANSRDGVKRYQKMRGLKVDGIAGPKTWAPILRALG